MTLEEIVTEKRRVYDEKSAELDDFAKHGSMSSYEYYRRLKILHDAVVTAFSELRLAETQMITAERTRVIEKCLLDNIKDLEAIERHFYEESRWYY